MKNIKTALTFDDVLLVPERSEIKPADANLKTRLTGKITLATPLISAAMDTVTEAGLAIAMAQEGGIGIIHKNLSVDEQAAEVRKVKRFESGIIRHPITISPEASVDDVFKMQQKHRISALPVSENGVVLGIVTSRDVRFENRKNARVEAVMTPQRKLVAVKPDTDLETVRSLLQKHRIERVLICTEDYRLKGMITARDIQKSSHFPNATTDEQKRLRVGAAVGVGAGTSERVRALVDAQVDVIVVDTAHGHSKSVLERVEKIKNEYPDLDVIAGNIATGQAALDLASAGADCVKVGIGPGSICTTRVVVGVGVPQISAIADVYAALKNSDIPLIADGGVRYSGDVAKAFAAGAGAVMLGSMFAGTEEAPGEVILYQGRSYKAYRGMGSIGAMSRAHGSADRYFQNDVGADKLIPEGVEGRVPYKGSVRPIIQQIVGGVRASMGYLNCQNLGEMRSRAKFVQITRAGMAESHVHDVAITKEAPNYHR